MSSVAKITVSLASLALLAGMTACAPTPQPAPAETATAAAPARTSSPAPTEEVVSEIPAAFRESSPWIVYPDGFKCQGTEGCPNNFVSVIGQPSDPLPEGVEYYDPAKHNYDPATGTGMVMPAAPAYCDTSYTPKLGSTPFDQGPRARAEGEVEYVDGFPKFYTVASNDYLPSIGDRFCLDYSTIGQMSDLDPHRDIWPGDVLTLLP